MRKCAEFQLQSEQCYKWTWYLSLEQFCHCYYAISVWPWRAFCMYVTTGHLHQSGIRTIHSSRTCTYLSYVNNRNFHISTICKKIKNHLWNAKTTATKCVLQPTVKGFGGKRALLYLLVYKSTPHFPGQKSDFSSFMVKEIKFRPIEISQNVNLFFLRMYWKHGELKKAEV